MTAKKDADAADELCVISSYARQRQNAVMKIALNICLYGSDLRTSADYDVSGKPACSYKIKIITKFRDYLPNRILKKNY
jgi:hypothetical protein